MKVANGVAMLEIAANVMGAPRRIYPTLLWEGDTVILVDAGYPGQWPLIREAMEQAGMAADQLNKVIITHHDVDHVGSLPNIVRECPRVQVLAHEQEKSYIQGEKQPVKVARLESQLDSLPEEMKSLYEKLKASFENLKTPVDRTLTAGEELPHCGGITVIYTPGHTPGHISLYLRQSKTLITGDALLIEEGRLLPMSQHIHWDAELAAKSLQELTQYDIQAVICYHGGLYKDNPNRRIAELASGH
ncbi:MBL fold metallo-hydrolase [Desulforamulus ruminis]|uniref:Beta-lactamase domain protein n=1 Tax=Desulforamulus ruminis (strain ATCC 23193 / DSM 2154 / NCIMB 8452 / DL) TaxID=696281 RepID=F6DK75_DESRL|nr:MBL fold metallo-hydrolase [Desulforamulus ruminis]AEG61492.1 beta-lactamase domain protein [Desulforamulus ruminis DSM 2154]